MHDEEDFEDVGSDGEVDPAIKEPPTPGNHIPPEAVPLDGQFVLFDLALQISRQKPSNRDKWSMSNSRHNQLPKPSSGPSPI